MTLKQSATSLAKAGWRIHPLIPNKKRPLLDAWQKLATTDLAQVAQWWSRWPKANIGIATGGRICVVDLDTKHPPVDGIDEWQGLCIKHDLDDTTLTAKTPSGGLHLFFSKSIEIRNSAGKLAPGVDVRGDGGYVVAVPSIVDGKPYTWETKAPIAPLPMAFAGWLYRQPTPKVEPGDIQVSGKDCSPYVKAAISRNLVELAAAVNGTKHDVLNRVSFAFGQLLGSPWVKSLDRATLEAQIWSIVEDLPDVEDYDAAFRTMQRAIDEGMTNPRPEPQRDYPQLITLYGQETLKPRMPLLIVDDQDIAIMCLETVQDEIGVLAPTRAGVPWAAAWSVLVAGCECMPVIVWMREIAKSVVIANALLRAGVKTRVYRGEAQDLKPWLRGLL